MKVYGKNVFNELSSNVKNIRKVYLSKNFNDKEIINYIKENKIAYETVDNNRLEQMVEGKHQGIVLDVNEYEYFDLSECLEENVVVILDHLEDPHNFGAIIRSCEALGINSIIIPKDRSVSVNATVMKTSAGAISYVKIIQVNNLVNAINKLKDNNFFIYATDMDGKDFETVEYANKKALIIGNEGKGISRLVKDNSDEIISIPMKGKINSLNASVAAGIILNNLSKND